MSLARQQSYGSHSSFRYKPSRLDGALAANNEYLAHTRMRPPVLSHIFCSGGSATVQHRGAEKIFACVRRGASLITDPLSIYSS